MRQQITPETFQDEINEFYEEACELLNNNPEFFNGFKFQNKEVYQQVYEICAGVITMIAIFLDIAPLELYRRPLALESREAIIELIPYIITSDDDTGDFESDNITRLIVSQVLYCMRFSPAELHRYVRYIIFTEITSVSDDEEEDEEEMFAIRYPRGDPTTMN